jgi:hypothetical protein
MTLPQSEAITPGLAIAAFGIDWERMSFPPDIAGALRPSRRAVCPVEWEVDWFVSLTTRAVRLMFGR